MKKVNEALDNILSSKPTSQRIFNDINLIGMVRAGATKEEFEFALGDSGSWVSFPRSLVENIKELGALEVDGNFYSVVNITIRRPPNDTAWFDMLSFTLQRAAQFVNSSPCSCQHDAADNAQQITTRARRLGGGSTASCFFCWIYTGGKGEMWCYLSGNC